MQITGGKVTFLRRVQASQFEPQEAIVELAFTLAEGEELHVQLDHVANLARHKALEMVGLKPQNITATEIKQREKEPRGPIPGDALLGELVDATLESAKKVVTDQKEAYAAKMNQEKEGQPKPVDDLVIPGLRKSVPIAASAERILPGFLERTKNVELSDPDEDLITDQDLVAAVTNTNAVVKDPKKIHAIREKYVKLPKGLRDIGQADRPAFLQELAKLKVGLK